MYSFKKSGELQRSLEDFWRQSMNDCNFGSRSETEKDALLLCFHTIAPGTRDKPVGRAASSK